MAGEATLVTEVFRERFPNSTAPAVFRAPGRANLIGEHTDYNMGIVLPIALEMACFVASAPSGDGMFRVYSQNLRDGREWPASAVSGLQRTRHWSDYPVGVAQQLEKIGYLIHGVNMAIYSTVPVGSGLSSSASLEISSALAILGDRTVDQKSLALLAQRAEREFVGVPCGIMDQYVSVFGEPDRAVMIDCRSISHQTAALPENVKILAVNSMVKHSLGNSAYEDRVRECEEAVEQIRTVHPAVQSLRDVTAREIDELQPHMNATTYRRARHVASEIERVVAFGAAAQKGDLHGMGRLFLASHRSLQRDYQVSCDELDFLVDTASSLSGVYGSRMTGGGFGGCTVNLVAPDRTEAFATNITEAYRKRFGIVPAIYTCIPSAGAGKIA